MKRTLCVLAIITMGILLFVSCSPVQETTRAPTGTPASTVPPATTEPPVRTTVPSADKPQYGGQIVVGSSANWIDFDEVFGFFGAIGHPQRLTNEELWTGDWARGPAGTNETDFGVDRGQFKTGAIAESWDFSGFDEGKLTFKIRKGIRFALNPASEASRLVNGRELTAEDVVFSVRQVVTNPRAFMYSVAAPLRTGELSAPDKYTFVVKVTPGTVGDILLRLTDSIRVVPREVVDRYGDMRDWRNSVGSGPFILTDWVDNSSVTFVRNRAYWGTNPVGPGKGDQLPYADSVKVLIIPDLSSRQAAFRTGRIDVLAGQNWEDGPVLMRQVRGVQSKEWGRSGSPAHTAMRTDRPPYNDVRVRRALMMALDFQAISKALFGPDARILTWPIGYYKEYKDAYLGLDDPECPASVKELYSYKPEKAKELLKEAGYPAGFKTSVITGSTDTTIIDMYSMFKDMWAKVGVDLTLDVREFGVWTSIYRARSYDHMVYGTSSPIILLYEARSMWGDTMTNASYVNDPKVDEARTKMMALAYKDPAQADRIHKELMKYVLDQAWMIPTPSPVSYTLWQPWLKNYYGNSSVGYMNDVNWTQWAWVDQALKKSMGR